MAYSHSDLHNVAVALHRRGPSNNPATNPSAISQIPQASMPVVKAVLQHPTYLHVAMNGPNAPAPGASGGSGAIASGNPGSGVAGTGTANQNLGYGPAHMRRTPNTRHQILGFASAACAAGTATGVSATPYRPFRASRMIISAVFLGLSGGATISQPQVGSAPQYANLNAEPCGIFAAGLNGGFCDFDEAAPSIAIGAQVTSTNTATFYGALVGATRRAKDNNRPADTKVQRLPIANTIYNIAASANVTVTPTMQFWGRQVILDGTAADQLGVTATASTGCASFNINGLFVGSDPQFMNLPTASAPVPGNLFNGLFDLFEDFDMADTAVPYVFQNTNVGTATVTFGGVILGDVDRRRLSSFGEDGTGAA